MAAGGLQKAVIPLKSISALSAFPDGTYGHYVRYRIISEDRNRFSHWSPIYAVRTSDVEPVDGVVELNSTPNGTVVNMVWGDKLHKTAYDVFVNWDYAITSAVRTNGTTVLTTENPHKFVIGDSIRVLNIDPAIVSPNTYITNGFNGVFTITAITNNTITYVDKYHIDGTPKANATASIGADSEVEYAEAFYHGTPTVHSYQFLLTHPGAKTMYVYVQLESVAQKPVSQLQIFSKTELL